MTIQGKSAPIGVTIEGSQQDLAKLQTAISRYVRVQLQNFHSFDSKTPAQNEQGLNIPYLQPDGLVHHELFFGCLTHDSDRPKIKIGTVQLFDLVAALEAYQTTITAPLSTKHRPQRKIVPIGAGIAAVAIAAIAINNLRSSQMQQDVAVNPSAPSPENATTDEIKPPVKPSSKSKNIRPKLTEPLASTKRLPPPPAVETPKPKPNIPDPADYSRSEVARRSGLNNAAQKPSRDRAPESVVIAPVDTDAISTKRESRSLEDAEEIETNQRSILQKDTADLADELETAKSSPKPNELSQIQAYFLEKWQPPKDLQESLEYRLLLNPNGSIARTIPLGKAARFYLDRTSIPRKGEAFISPISEPSPSTIRLLLNPDGRVQAFIESR